MYISPQRPAGVGYCRTGWGRSLSGSVEFVIRPAQKLNVDVYLRNLGSSWLDELVARNGPVFREADAIQLSRFPSFTT